MKALKSFFFNVCILVLSISFFLLVAEGVTRLLRLAPEIPPEQTADHLQFVIEFDPKLETKYRPNVSKQIKSQYNEFSINYAFNNLGLRDYPFNLSFKKDRFLVLGNSFVEGWGVNLNESFVKIAEAKLNIRKSKNFQLINAGISGYGAVQNYLFLHELLEKIKPKKVIFVLVGTMVQADLKFIKRAELNKEGLAIGLDIDKFLSGGHAASTRQSWLKELAYKSALFRLIYVRLDNYSKLNAIVLGDPQTDLFAAYRNTKNLDSLYEPTFLHILAMKNLAEKNHATFTLILQPLPFQLSETEWSEGRKIYKISSLTDTKAELNLVNGFCKKNKIDCLFPHNVMFEYIHSHPSETLFFNYDFHLNKLGHQVQGDWLSEQL